MEDISIFMEYDVKIGRNRGESEEYYLDLTAFRGGNNCDYISVNS